MLIHLLKAIVEELAVTRTDVSCFIGPEYVRQEHAGRRVVFVPDRGVIDPTMRIGDTVAFVDAGGGRSLHTRKCGCAVHVWGDPVDSDDEDSGIAAYLATEELMHDVIRALHKKGVGQRSISEEEWNDETLDVKYGRELVFRFMAFIPVPAKPSQRTSNDPPGDTKANITTTLQFESGDATGCSGTGT